MANFIKLTKSMHLLKAGEQPETVWVNAEQIIEMHRRNGEATRIFCVGGCEKPFELRVTEEPEEIIKKINWAEAKRNSVIANLQWGLIQKKDDGEMREANVTRYRAAGKVDMKQQINRFMAQNRNTSGRFGPKETETRNQVLVEGLDKVPPVNEYEAE